MQWKVQVMGLKNAGAQFQRMMEWALRDIDNADPYIDDIIIGSTGETDQEMIQNYAMDVRRVLVRLAELRLVCCPRKSHFLCAKWSSVGTFFATDREAQLQESCYRSKNGKSRGR